MTSSALPIVAVPYGYRSIPAMELAAAAEGVCQLVWLVQGSDPECAAMGALLSRLGPVVDVEGMSGAEAAAALAHFEPRAAVAFRDEDLVIMADVAAHLRLAFHRPEVAGRLVDKVVQRQALAAKGLPVPRCLEVPAARNGSIDRTVLDQARFPAVLKPRQGSGSRHTLVVHSRSELVAVLDWLAATPESLEDMVLEEYLPSAPGTEREAFADYVSVETLATTDGLHHVAVTGRLHQAHSFRETGFFIPSHLDPNATEAVLGTATAALEALAVTFGCVHTEVKLTPSGPRIIEVNGRMGGGVSEMLQVAAGINLVSTYLRAALGQPVGLRGLLECERIGYRLFYQPPFSACRVVSMGGLKEVGALPGVEAVGLHVGPGDALDPSEGTRSFLFSVVGSATDHDQVREINHQMYTLADVVYEHADPDPRIPAAAELVSAGPC